MQIYTVQINNEVIFLQLNLPRKFECQLLA